VESGFDYRGARFYDGDIVRFNSLDPLAMEFPSWSDYNYVLGNPVMLTDPDGRCPICPIIPIVWAAIEVGFSAYDIYDVTTTVTDPNATTAQKLTSVGGATAGLILPGGGYSAADDVAKGAVKIVDNYADDIVKKASKEGTDAHKTANKDMIPEYGSGKGTHNPKVQEAIKKGNKAHAEFKDKVKNKPGWKSEPNVGKNGDVLRPDALSPSGKPVEYKPNTPSGKAKGKSQLKKYEKATGEKGRVIYYDPSKY